MKTLDLGSLVVMVITFALFTGAIFVKGLTHDLLLEAGVFLVSVKLIIMAYKNAVSADAIQQQLNEVRAMLNSQASKSSAEDGEKEK